MGVLCLTSVVNKRLPPQEPQPLASWAAKYNLGQGSDKPRLLVDVPSSMYRCMANADPADLVLPSYEWVDEYYTALHTALPASNIHPVYYFDRSSATGEKHATDLARADKKIVERLLPMLEHLSMDTAPMPESYIMPVLAENQCIITLKRLHADLVMVRLCLMSCRL